MTPCRAPTSRDAATAVRPPEPVAGLIDRGIDGLRIAVAGGHFARGGDPDVLQAVQAVAAALGVTA